ncbi:hypothetical protein I6G80_24525 (plasmid) [Bacillus licheniformis]|uniref:Uncharacterized protein n=1 Tax=Bacillus licheniformis TaxID=1402 RepID=A0AB37GSG4_BACLI|nr:hypothetical protein I6G80_00500 [Bacillus licheniformis]QPR75175.1 hypothetical protein I6G80_24525 [Bacillus licheniformis]
MRGALFLAILLVMLAFRDFFNSIGSIMSGLTPVLYAGIPYLLSGFLVKQTYNGKKIHLFLFDFANYFLAYICQNGSLPTIKRFCIQT